MSIEWIIGSSKLDKEECFYLEFLPLYFVNKVENGLLNLHELNLLLFQVELHIHFQPTLHIKALHGSNSDDLWFPL